MAKNNLKTINNNGSSLNSSCQLYSKYSNTYNTFLYLNVIQLILSFNQRYYYNLFKYKSFLLSKNVYFFKNFNLNQNLKKNKKLISSDIRLFFLNGLYTYLIDYFNFKVLTESKKGSNFKKIYKGLRVY